MHRARARAHTHTHTYARTQDEDSWKAYLLNVQQNVKAEYWAFLENSCYAFPCWRSRRLKELVLDPVLQLSDGEFLYKMFDPRCPTAKDSGNYHLNLVIRKGTLCILTAEKRAFSDDGVTLYAASTGMSINDQWPDDADREDEEEVFLLGYIGDRMNDLAAVNALLSLGEGPSLLRSVAYPTRRELVPFESHQTLPDPEASSPVPINQSQREVLSNLQHDIEFIQGPPGTGKFEKFRLP